VVIWVRYMGEQGLTDKAVKVEEIFASNAVGNLKFKGDEAREGFCPGRPGGPPGDCG